MGCQIDYADSRVIRIVIRKRDAGSVGGNVPVSEPPRSPFGARQLAALAPDRIEIVVNVVLPLQGGPQHTTCARIQRTAKFVQRTTDRDLLGRASLHRYSHQLKISQPPLVVASRV